MHIGSALLTAGTVLITYKLASTYGPQTGTLSYVVQYGAPLLAAVAIGTIFHVI